MSEGRYKTERIFYPNRWQSTEDVIADGYYYAQRKPQETIEIAAHLMDAAYANRDDALFDIGRELMRVANSPCIFQADYSAENATDINNRPPMPVVPEFPADLQNGYSDDEEDWDSSRDGIFDKKIKPQMIKKAIDGVKSEKIKKRPYFFVAFTILKILGYIPIDTSPRDFLLWVNLHFNCGWSEDSKKKNLLFKLEGTIQTLKKKHPSEWKDAKDDEGKDFWGNNNLEYYKLAISFKNVFTMTMVDGKPVGDSESFEHLKDRVEFLSGAQDYSGVLYAPEESYINLGK